MKLYCTANSPYARLIRVVIHEKGLTSRVEVVEAKTRTPGSPYYAINPSGRVPYLERSDGSSLEDSQVIALYLDQLAGPPHLTVHYHQNNWTYGRLETYARSFLDGLAVYARETRRPKYERSPTTLQHEIDRATRLAEFWNAQIVDPLMQGPVNIAQLLLIVALDFGARSGITDLERGRQALAEWAARMRQRPSVKATAS